LEVKKNKKQIVFILCHNSCKSPQAAVKVPNYVDLLIHITNPSLPVDQTGASMGPGMLSQNERWLQEMTQEIINEPQWQSFNHSSYTNYQ
jgi:hypothetical protein